MGDVIKDFYKSDAPQFKGRSKEKRREMAIAAKLTAERGPQNEAATEVAMSPAELALQKKKTMIDKMITMKRQQALGKTKTEEVEVDEKYQGMYQSPAPTYKRLMSGDEKARMSPGRRAMAKSDELEKSEPGSKRAKAQKKASMQMARNFKSARATTEEVVREGDGDPCWDTHKQVGMKKKGNRMVPNCVPKNKVKEETEDSLRDRRMERGGVGGNQRCDRPVRGVRTLADKKKGEKKYDGMSALAKVKAELEKKHGKGSVK